MTLDHFLKLKLFKTLHVLYENKMAWSNDELQFNSYHWIPVYDKIGNHDFIYKIRDFGDSLGKFAHTIHDAKMEPLSEFTIDERMMFQDLFKWF
jgi:hypothetical protein